jgi:hypothetical protein
MADAPDGIKLGRHRDMRGRAWHRWLKRGILGAIALFLALGVANVFGQRPSGVTRETRDARLKVYAPTSVRGGLYYEGRYTVEAKRELKKATLYLSQGWLEGITVNTIEPSPVGEASRNGSLSLELGHIPAGETHTLYIQYQVNPTNVGRRSADVQLYDGDEKLMSVHRVLTIWP